MIAKSQYFNITITKKITAEPYMQERGDEVQRGVPGKIQAPCFITLC